jgi:hypothetical protein
MSGCCMCVLREFVFQCSKSKVGRGENRILKTNNVSFFVGHLIQCSEELGGDCGGSHYECEAVGMGHLFCVICQSSVIICMPVTDSLLAILLQITYAQN